MARVIFPLLVIILISLSCSETETIPSNHKIKEVSFTGSGYELGLQHGKALKEEIAEIVNKWKENTSRQLGRDADLVLQEFFEYADFTDAIKEWTPDLYEEVRGIADGAERAFNEVFVLNLLDEFWVYVDNLNNHHCSDLGVPAGNGYPAMIAQNMDIETYTDGYQTLMRIREDENAPEQLVLTHPGLIALNGMNSQGVGVVVNTIMQLKAAPTGLPVAFVVRRIIRSTDKDELLTFINEVPHASGQSYILGIRDEVYNFEASTNKVVRHDPLNKNGSVYHTNHPIVNDNLKPHFLAYMPGQDDDSDINRTNSYIRLAAVKNRMTGNENFDTELIKSTLRSKDDINNPVCRNITRGSFGFTFASTIMILSEQPEFMITAGPPDESEYKTYTFDN